MEEARNVKISMGVALVHKTGKSTSALDEGASLEQGEVSAVEGKQVNSPSCTTASKALANCF